MRYFLAIDVPEFSDVTQKIFSPAISIPNERHMTLHYFGSLEKEDLDWIKVKLNSFSFTAFDVQSDTVLSAFSNWERCRTLYVGFRSKQLVKLASQIRSLLKNRFVAKDFVPHVTVGRVKGELAEDTIEEFQLLVFEPVSFRVNQICLYKSSFGENGVVYELVKKWKLS